MFELIAMIVGLIGAVGLTIFAYRFVVAIEAFLKIHKEDTAIKEVAQSLGIVPDCPNCRDMWQALINMTAWAQAYEQHYKQEHNTDPPEALVKQVLEVEERWFGGK